MPKYEFVYDDRLKIDLLVLHMEWSAFSSQERAQILYRWEQIRGRIPERMIELERIISDKQEQLNVKENFIQACQLNSEISELASCINDLHLWFRVDQQLDTSVSHY